MLGIAVVALRQGARNVGRYECPVGHFREVLLAMEGTANANGLAEEILLLRTIRSRGDRILQNAGFNHLLTMAVVRNRLLLPGAGIAPEITKGDEDRRSRPLRGTPYALSGREPRVPHHRMSQLGLETTSRQEGFRGSSRFGGMCY